MSVVIPFPRRPEVPAENDGFRPETLRLLKHMLRERLLSAEEIVIVGNILRGAESDPPWGVSTRVRHRIEDVLCRADAEGISA